MALSRQQKEALLEQYSTGLAVAPHAFLVSYKGISAPKDNLLRQKVRDSGGSYVVVKNTLALRAIDGKGLAALAEYFSGPTAVAYTDGDVVTLAKTLTDFAKEVPTIELKAGMVDSRPVAAEQIQEIASLPAREVIVAKLLFLLQSPITRLARGLAAISRDFVVVLDQVRQQKEQQG